MLTFLIVPCKSFFHDYHDFQHTEKTDFKICAPTNEGANVCLSGLTAAVVVVVGTSSRLLTLKVSWD